MSGLSECFNTFGPDLAALLDRQREEICEQVGRQMALAFPALCYDPRRADAREFQQTTFRKTPQRFHTAIQAALRFRTLSVIEQEYRWLWKTAPRYGVDGRHLLTQVRLYFAAARSQLSLPQENRNCLELLESEILGLVDRITRGKS